MRTSRLCLLAAGAALLSCGRQTEGPKPSAPSVNTVAAKPTRTAVFDHRQSAHAKLACESCHARAIDDTPRVAPQRPPHAACLDCHSTEDYLATSTSEPLCAVCHQADHVLDASLKTRVLPFPKELKQFGLAAFSHRAHMDAAKMSPHPNGYGCEFCHTGGLGLTAKGFPAHAECYSCHIHQAGQKLGLCRDCHAPAGDSLIFGRQSGAAARDYNFQHSGHTKSKDGSAMPCSPCHRITAETARVSDIARIRPVPHELHTSSCWGTCHIQKEETRCGKCHVRGVPIPAKAG